MSDGRKILVADDEQQLALALKIRLQSQGYQINLAEIAKSILRESEVVKNPDRVIIPIGQPQQPMMSGGAPTGPTSNAAGGAPSSALATVTARGGIPQATDAFQNGRAYSESMN